MMRRLCVVVGVIAMCCNLCSCLFVAGAAGGAGAAVWLSGKLTQQVNCSYEEAIDATQQGLKSMGMPVDKLTQEKNMTQVRSKYTDGKDVWVDIHHVTSSSTRIEVRVGVVHADKIAAAEILKKINERIYRTKGESDEAR